MVGQNEEPTDPPLPDVMSALFFFSFFALLLPYITITTAPFYSMSKFQLLKKSLLKPNKIFNIYNTPKRKNFLLAPPVFAYSIDRREVATLPQKKSILVTDLLSASTSATHTKPKLFSHRTNLCIARQYATSQHHHKPITKAELLAQARGFFDRLKIRIKYPLMRQIRPWTLNDATALFSWLFLGHTVWLLAGTTSFVSLILWLANSLQFQGL